jgi:hypothetical protein
VTIFHAALIMFVQPRPGANIEEESYSSDGKFPYRTYSPFPQRPSRGAWLPCGQRLPTKSPPFDRAEWLYYLAVEVTVSTVA